MKNAFGVYQSIFDDHDYSFIPSFQVTRDANTFDPIWFYHIHKTGGMTLNYALNATASFHFKTHGINAAFLKLDEPPNIPNREEGSLIKTTPDLLLVSSQLKYGIHTQFYYNYKLVSLFREPVSRVKSLYTYLSMRRNTSSTPEGFAEFYRKPENQNQMVAMTSGCQGPPTRDSLEMAKEHLDRNFWIFSDLSDLPTIMSLILSVNNMPNVLVKNSNRTLPQFQLNAGFNAEEVEELNILDNELYRFVLKNKRVPFIEKNETISEFTAVSNELENEETSRSESNVLPTEALLHKLNAGEDLNSIMLDLGLA